MWSHAALRLASRGHDVAVCTKYWTPLPATVKSLQEHGCGVWLRSDNETSGRVRRALQRMVIRRNRGGPNSIGWIERITRAFGRADLVIISQTCNYDGVNWMRQCAEQELPYVAISQAAAECYWPSDDVVSQLLPALRNATRCFFVSRRNLELTQTQIAATLSNASVVRNPFKTPKHAPVEYPSSRAPFRLACVARMEPYAKGQDLLLHVLTMSKWRERDLQVTFYGSGPCVETLGRLARHLNLSDAVTFGGFVQRPEAIWSASHALILPSRFEGLPLVLIEAMVAGRMAIATDVAGITEVTEDNVTGFIASAPTLAALDEAMERAWRRRDEWDQIGMKAHDAAKLLVPDDPVDVFCDQLLTASGRDKGNAVVEHICNHM